MTAACVSASQLADDLASGRADPVDTLEAAIACIATRDVAINAVVARDFDTARAQAIQARRQLAAGERRPLLGVPVSVKESFDMRGLDTTWGLPAFRGRPASDDSVVVQRLRDAGAIIIGKTNVSSALSDWHCQNPVYGRTANPWDTRRSPGGSSGGSAAALAAGLSYLDVGSDVAGSIRIPAAYCGVYGHRATPGLICGQGHQLPGRRGGSELGSFGPLARSVDDLALALRVLAGPGAPDAQAWQLRLPPPRHTTLAQFRVLLLDAHPLVRTSTALRDSVQRLTDLLARCGATVARASERLPDLGASAECFTKLLVIQNMARLPPQYVQAELSKPRGGEGGDRLMAIGRAAAGSAVQWFAAQEKRALLTLQWRRCFEQFDVVVCPASTTSAFADEGAASGGLHLVVDGQPAPYFDHLAWISAASLAGLPVTQIPLGIGADGMPLGLQAIGAPFADLTTLALASLIARESVGFVAPDRDGDPRPSQPP